MPHRNGAVPLVAVTYSDTQVDASVHVWLFLRKTKLKNGSLGRCTKKKKDKKYESGRYPVESVLPLST